jgi:hypothetical protein
VLASHVELIGFVSFFLITTAYFHRCGSGVGLCPSGCELIEMLFLQEGIVELGESVENPDKDFFFRG